MLYGMMSDIDSLEFSLIMFLLPYIGSDILYSEHNMTELIKEESNDVRHRPTVH